MRKILVSSLVFAAGLFLVSCASTGAPTDYKSLLNGTFVYSGPTSSTNKTITLTLSAGSRTFSYAEAGGIKNNSYSGQFMILGDTVVFTNGEKQTVKHKVAKTSGGFSLSYVENDNPVSFAFEPIGSSRVLQFYRQ